MAGLSQSIESVHKTSHLRRFETQRDLVQVADLIELCFNETLDSESRRFLQRMRTYASQPRFLQWSASAEWNGIPINGFVWEQDQKLVGNASLIPYRLQGNKLYLIANVAVHPDYRRRGIARQLTVQAVNFAQEKGAHSVWLHVRQENLAACQLYQSLGFIERARRTSWVGDGEISRLSVVPGIKIKRANTRDWEAQRHQLMKDYPPELSWHMSFDLESLNPGFMGGVRRFFTQIYLEQWAAYQGKAWLGSLALQFTPPNRNILWLSLPAQTEEELVQALLLHVRKMNSQNRPLNLDYPAGQYDSAILSAGFSNHQTLVWMELPLRQ